MNYSKEIGGYIKRVRKAMKISQVEFGELLKSDQASISRIENGKQSISIDFLIEASKILKVDIKSIIERDLLLNEEIPQELLPLYLQEARIKIGYSEEEVAQVFKRNSSLFLRKWESGRSVPSKQDFVTLMSFYKSHSLTFPKQHEVLLGRLDNIGLTEEAVLLRARAV